MLIEPDEHLQNVGTLTEILGQLLIDRRRLVVLPRIEVMLRQLLLIRGVVGAQSGCFFHTGKRERIVTEFTLIHRQIEPRLRCIRIDVETAVQQVESGIVMACILLIHRLEEEIIIAKRGFG